MGIINAGNFKEGEVLNKWFSNKMVRRNQNVLGAVTGSTGSGKSYMGISIANRWYLSNFGIPYPVETHVCFTIEEVMRLLNGKTLKRGEIIILEEAGVNIGNLDFQNRVSKLFTFVLQSFRSMNIGIIFNLPVLTMMNKSARYLIHFHFVTAGIDYDKGMSRVKPYFRQVNQNSGKVYQKFLRAKVGKKVVSVKKFVYSVPPQGLVDAYEKKKLKFVSDLNESFVRELEELDRVENKKMARNTLTDAELEAWEDWQDGLTMQQSADKREKHVNTIFTARARCKKKGYTFKKKKNP